MSYPELEELMEGMEKNSEREREEMEKGSTRKGNANDLLEFIGSSGGL